MEKILSLNLLRSSSRIFILYSFLFIPVFGLSAQVLDFVDHDSRVKAASLKRLWESSTSSTPSTSVDLTFARLLLTLDPAVRHVQGSVSTYFKTKPGYAGKITFDLSDSLQISAVKYHGEVISSYTHQGNRVTIEGLRVPAGVGEVDSIMIDYQGVPVDDGLGSFTVDEHEGVPVLYTLSEPYGAKDWWPCRQDLNDKMDSVMVVVTVPKGYRAASNGMLISQCGCEDRDIYCWLHKHPIAAYLVAVAVTNYSVYSDFVPLTNIGINDSIEILNYVYPETLERTKGESKAIIRPFQIFNELFGLYPFADERYGHAEWNWGGGMEHQTMSFMGSFGYDLLAHELAHQWFGDFLTCGSWRDIWLNEGFATYLTGLCYERDQDGIYWEPFKRLSIRRVVREPAGSVYCYDTTDVDRIFDARLSYSKGAMVLHMLRWEMGDSAFFRGINQYLYDPAHANGYARTEDLKRHLEAAADTSFTEFFNDWIYGEGYPQYTMKYRALAGTAIEVELTQESSHPSVAFFENDIQIRVQGDWPTGQTKDFRLSHANNGQRFVIDPGFVADTVLFDPDRWICTEKPLILGLDPIAEEEFRVYPNPAGNNLWIDYPMTVGDIRVRLYDMTGRKVSEIRQPGTTGRLQISVAGLNPGLYLVEARSGAWLERRKVAVRLKP